MDELTFFKEQTNELFEENLQLKSEKAFLEGKVEVYERFLKDHGFIKESEK